MGELEARALDFLDDTIRDMNSRLYEFNKVVETGIALTEAQEYVTLSTNFFRESLAWTRDTSGDSDVNSPPLTYLPWVTFRQMTINNTLQKGYIEYYSAFNSDDEGRIYIWPRPSDTMATSTVLDIEYYRRIPLISSVSSGATIDVPAEVQTALVYGAQKRMAIHVQGASHPDVQALAALEAQAAKRLVDIDGRHPDEKMRFRLVHNIPSASGTKRHLSNWWRS